MKIDRVLGIITILLQRDKVTAPELAEEFGVSRGRKSEFSVGYTNRDYMVPWVLRFGDKARVVEPADLADEVKKKAKNIILNYEHDM